MLLKKGMLQLAHLLNGGGRLCPQPPQLPYSFRAQVVDQDLLP